MKMIDDIDATMYNLFSEISRYNRVINNRLDLIRNMSFDKLNSLVKELDISNYSVVKMLSKSARDNKFEIED